ncbi:MAG: glycosyltransferase, partial [Lentisphaerae bacterium]|nr:glycosyltransferase [Lentisphaerota bacterium]
MNTIMHLVLSLRPGGRGTTILDLCQCADRARFEPFVCCLEEQGRPDAELRGVRVVALGKKPGLDLTAVPRLARFMRREKVDLVHAHEGASLFYGALAGRLAGRPAVVNTYHRSRDVDTRTSLD